jgi:hypothetical protein
LAYGTNGGLYFGTSQTIFYKNNSMPDWEDYGDGLPIHTNVHKAIPFYRDSKIRIASYGKGIWESGLRDSDFDPIAQIAVDELEKTSVCIADGVTFKYVDLSVLDHEGATWNWTFEGGLPATSSSIEEEVTYDSPGTYLTILRITDTSGDMDVDSIYVDVLEPTLPSIVDEDFESGIFPPEYFSVNNPDANITWEGTAAAGGFGESMNATVFRCFDYGDAGQMDDLSIKVDMTFLADAELTFDVAYARWGEAYSDSLRVIVSTDCTSEGEVVFNKGGEGLSTRDDLTESFIPESDDWRTETIDLSAYEGEYIVTIIFRGINAYGNNIYLDNINLNGLDFTTVKEKPIITNTIIYPNPVGADSEFRLVNTNGESMQYQVYNLEGKLLILDKEMIKL